MLQATTDAAFRKSCICGGQTPPFGRLLTSSRDLDGGNERLTAGEWPVMAETSDRKQEDYMILTSVAQIQQLSRSVLKDRQCRSYI